MFRAYNALCVGAASPRIDAGVHDIDDRICYTLEGQTYIGTVIWVCAPANTLDEQLPTRYIVQSDTNENSHHIVLSADTPPHK